MINMNISLFVLSKGPEIRTGFLQDHKPITLDKGQTLEISTN